MSEEQEQQGKQIIIGLVKGLDPSTQCEIGHRDFDTEVYPVKLKRQGEETDLRISREDMEDFPATREIQQEIEERLRLAIKGILRPLPKAYVTRSEDAFKLDVGARGTYRGPYQAVHAYEFKIADMRSPSHSAEGNVAISRFAHRTFFSDSRQILRVCVNRIRKALDDKAIRFGEKKDLFAEDSWIRDTLYRPAPSNIAEDQIREFIAQKLYWTGYRLQGMNDLVLLDDLVDYEYLGIGLTEMKRNAQLLEHEGLLNLMSEEISAIPTTKLVSQMEDNNYRLNPKRRKHGFTS